MTFMQKYGFILLIFLLCSAFTIAGVMKEANSATNSYDEVIIEEGDTLWGLAQNYSTKDHPKKWITKVIELNNLQSTSIKTGETLKVPKVDSDISDSMITELAGEE